MQKKQTRYYWVDVVRAIGIFLVFYAHILQRSYRLSAETVFFQYKLIYSFHMPLFFFVSGFFYKPKDGSRLTKIGVLFQKRIFPVFLFGGISLVIWPGYLYLKFGQIDYAFLFSNMLLYFQGHPLLNATVWFLVCLFTAEIWAVLFLSKIKTVLSGIFLSSFFLYFGYLLTSIRELEGYFIFPKNFWYIHESFLAFGFFAIGYTTFRWLNKLMEISPIARIVLIMIFGWLTVWSANLNAPFKEFVVIMKTSNHGNYYFFISAFAGILTTVLIASLIPRIRWVEYIGKNTLILLGTNGLFVSFFNSHIISWLDHYNNLGLVIFDSIWISVLTIGLSVPVIVILNRWLPQLAGKPQMDGPMLNNFSPPRFLFLRNNINKLSLKMGGIKDE